MPKLSVIVPVYNVEKYLARCLDSIINQTLRDMEIICVNDGSTDNSTNILEKYAKKDTRIIIINQKNQGSSGARNTGLKIATSDYCYFVDSDDWIELNTFETLLNIMLLNDVDAVVHSANNIAEDYSVQAIAEDCQYWFNKFDKPSGIYNISNNLYAEMMSVAWNKLYKMEIINKYDCKFPVSLINEDNAFLWTYFIHCSKYYYLNNRFYNYFRRKNSIIGTMNESEVVLDRLAIEKIILLTVKKYKNLSDYENFISTHFIALSREIYKNLDEKYYDKFITKISEFNTCLNIDKKISKFILLCKILHFFKLLKKIFSINYDKNNQHVNICIFGIKIKFRLYKDTGILFQKQYDIMNVFETNTTNIGDLSCAPCYYFPKLQDNAICVGIKAFTCAPKIKNKIIILGGGGILMSYFKKEINNIIKLAKDNKIIIWGCGYDNYIGKKLSYFNLSDIKYVGLRNYPPKNYDYIPCVSCMSNLFDKYKNKKPIHKYVLYLHNDYSENITKKIKNVPILYNKGTLSFEQAIIFLSSGEYILTNSYHGLYWGTLLGKKILVLPWFNSKNKKGFSYKFKTFKYTPVYVNEIGKYQEFINNTNAYPEALSECRKLNIEFYEKIKKYINNYS